jgi:hypothetical protein
LDIILRTIPKSSPKENVAFAIHFYHLPAMTRLQALTTEALTLTDAERAALASELLHTLPAVLSDTDEGVAEATRRDTDLSANPAKGVDWPTLKKNLGR